LITRQEELKKDRQKHAKRGKWEEGDSNKLNALFSSGYPYKYWPRSMSLQSIFIL